MPALSVCNPVPPPSLHHCPSRPWCVITEQCRLCVAHLCVLRGEGAGLCGHRTQLEARTKLQTGCSVPNYPPTRLSAHNHPLSAISLPYCCASFSHFHSGWWTFDPDKVTCLAFTGPNQPLQKNFPQHSFRSEKQ